MRSFDAFSLRSRPRLLTLESRDVPATIYAVGAGRGGLPTVNVYNENNNQVATFQAYDSGFRGGVKVGYADVNNDGTLDIVTGAGSGGGPHVKVFDGAMLLFGQVMPIRDFFAYDPNFRGGVNVTGGDVDGNGVDDIITGAGPGGGPHVIAYDGTNHNILMSFYAYDRNFTGGVSVGAGDFGGDGKTAEIVTGAGPGGGPHVVVYNFDPTRFGGAGRLASFYAFDQGFRGGVTVAGGAVTNNRDAANNLYADIIVGAGPGGGPVAQVYRLLDAAYLPDGQGDFGYFKATEFQVAPSDFRGGVRVGTVEGLNGVADILVGAGPGGGPQAQVFNRTSIGDLQTYTPERVTSFYAFDPAFAGGIFVG